MWRGTVKTRIVPLGPRGTDSVLIAVGLDRESSPGRDRELAAGSRVLIHARDEDVTDLNCEEKARRVGRELGNELAEIVRKAVEAGMPSGDPLTLLRQAQRRLLLAASELKGADRAKVSRLWDDLTECMREIDG